MLPLSPREALCFEPARGVLPAAAAPRAAALPLPGVALARKLCNMTQSEAGGWGPAQAEAHKGHSSLHAGSLSKGRNRQPSLEACHCVCAGQENENCHRLLPSGMSRKDQTRHSPRLAAAANLHDALSSLELLLRGESRRLLQLQAEWYLRHGMATACPCGMQYRHSTNNHAMQTQAGCGLGRSCSVPSWHAVQSAAVQLTQVSRICRHRLDAAMGKRIVPATGPDCCQAALASFSFF